MRWMQQSNRAASCQLRLCRRAARASGRRGGLRRASPYPQARRPCGSGSSWQLEPAHRPAPGSLQHPPVPLPLPGLQLPPAPRPQLGRLAPLLLSSHPAAPALQQQSGWHAGLPQGLLPPRPSRPRPGSHSTHSSLPRVQQPQPAHPSRMMAAAPRCHPLPTSPLQGPLNPAVTCSPRLRPARGTRAGKNASWV